MGMKKIVFLCMNMLIMGISGCSWKPNQNMAEYSESFFALDTYMTFTAYGMDAEVAVLVLRQCGITAALLDIGVENGIASVSVIASEGKLCDALSTALFVMGLEQAKEYWRQRQDYEMILIMEDGNIYLTEGMRDRFSLNSNYL